jgi:hypothetical protein
MKPLPLHAFDLSEVAVRERFEWALRQGNSTWLWPDVKVEGWRSAQRQFEVVLREVLIDGQARHVIRGDPRAISVAAYSSGIGPLLGHWLQNDLIAAEPNVAAVLELHLRHNTARMAKLSRWGRLVVDRLAANGVNPVVLKGMHTAFTHFPHPGTRPVSDIDLLILPQDKQAAADALQRLGFKGSRWLSRAPAQQCWRVEGERDRVRSLYLVHSDDPWSVDLQTSLSRRYSSGAPLIDLDTAIGPEDMEPSPHWEHGRVLSAPALVLQLACHASCGFGNLSLLRLVELALVIRHETASARFSWSKFLLLAGCGGALVGAYPALYQLEMLAPGTVPPDVLRETAASAPAMMRTVVHRLTPATGQRLIGWSLKERLMWIRSPLGLAREIASELIPGSGSFDAPLTIYKRRAWRLLRGQFAR